MSNWPAHWGPKVRYVTCYRGKPTFQRRHGSPRVVMEADPATDRAGFDHEYHQMMAAQANGTLRAKGKGKPAEEKHRGGGHDQTVGHLATLWRASPAFAVLKRTTAAGYVRFLDRALLTVVSQQSNRPFGEWDVPSLIQAHAIQLRAALPSPDPKLARIKTDSAYRDYHCVVLRNMFHWALGPGGIAWVQRNPFARLMPLHRKPVLNKAWKPEHWKQFLEHFPLGTQQHLSMVLLRYLGVRVSDLATLGADHKDPETGEQLSRLVADHRKSNKTGWRIEWIEYKNRESVARPIRKDRSLKVHPELYHALKHTPGAWERPTFVVSRLGRPYDVESVGEMFNRWCVDAGLPDGIRAHGVRRGGAKWLAENGASLHRIKGWGGWKELANVQRYTEEADVATLADDAVDLL